MRKSRAKPISQSTTGARTHSRAGAQFTELLFEIFRLYSRINAAGDILSTGTGLTSARWRVLGSVLPLPKSVAQVARRYAANANMVFKWLRDPRYAPETTAVAATPAFLPVAEHMIATKSWWDTVDLLAANVVGPLVAATPALRSEMDRWLVSDDLWLARSALLHQLKWKGDTDADWLFAACLTRAGDTEFFLRKAIGWALREYSKTDAAAVRRFVSDHDAELSGLSKREALKWLDRRAARGEAAVDDEVEDSASGFRRLSPPPPDAVSA